VHRLTVAVGTPCYVFFAGHKESDIQTPESMPGYAEYAFSYPPMIKDKQPLLDAIARRMVDDLGR